jgi:hypothetical protein
MKLLDERTCDGSRHFASLPQRISWGTLCDHVLLLPEAEMINFVADGPAQAWLDFYYRRHRFAVRACSKWFRLYVRDPQCPDLILFEVGCHFERLMDEPGTRQVPPLRCVGNDEGAVA